MFHVSYYRLSPLLPDELTANIDRLAESLNSAPVSRLIAVSVGDALLVIFETPDPVADAPE